MSTPTIDPDSFDRIEKLLVDAGEADTFEQAGAMLTSYRLQISATEDACHSLAWQAALLTAVNAGARAVHGGVHVTLAADVPCLSPLHAGTSLADALASHGATITDELDDGFATIVFGSASPYDGGGQAVHAVAGQWVAGVSPAPIALRQRPSVIAAMLAAAIAVSECFQRLRGYPVAGERSVGISLWLPGRDWLAPEAEGPELRELPSELWLLGLGHLGQAYAWVGLHLPYVTGAAKRAVLQDVDRLTPANRATSMLASSEHVNERKTRVLAAALERAGWETTIVERLFGGQPLYAKGDPSLLVVGVDNARARRGLDASGFPLIIDGGLGAGPDGFLAISVRRLPASRPSAQIWSPSTEDSARAERLQELPAYRELAARSGDRCGVEQLAGRTVATAFVGVATACVVLGSVVRELHGGERYELIDLSLRAPGTIATVPARTGQRPRLATAGYAVTADLTPGALTRSSSDGASE